MRLHRLELTGFGPFRERQVVDFDAFADDGIFLIAGRTGAGKSSVLDGVCFALYGGVPRYDGVEKRLRSDHCEPDEPTVALVEFSAGGRMWRVTRSPEYDRPKLRGDGLTTEPHRAQLDERFGDAWVGRAARPVDVARELDEVLGLSQQQFLQVILLAQNRFAEFLLAKNDDRQRLLRRLFGTRAYEGYQAALETRRRESERSLTAAGDGVGLLVGEAERLLVDAHLGGDDGVDAPDATGGASTVAAGTIRPTVEQRLERADTGARRADYRAETLTRERDDADAAHRAAEIALVAQRSLRERQEQRSRSRAALAALEDRRDRIDADRAVLRAAVAAEALRGPLDAVARVSGELAAAVAEREEAARTWRRGEPDAADADAAEPDEAALRAAVDALTGDLAVWTAALDSERTLAAAEAEQSAREARIAEVQGLLSALDAQVAAVPAQLAELEAALAAARDGAGGLDAAVSRLAESERRLTAARDAENLGDALHSAEAAYLLAGKAHAHAQSEVTRLLQRRIADRAGELAGALAEGQPCAVCGSTEHPAPAAAADDPVSDEVLATAEHQRDSAAQAEAADAARARAAREQHADAVARAGGADVDTCRADHQTATEAAQQARAAAARRDELVDQRIQLAGIADEAGREHERLTADLQALRETLAAATGRIEAARQSVSTARGPFPSVAERVAHGAARRAHAVRYADALHDESVAGAQLARATVELDVLLESAGLGSADDARAALRDARTRAEIDDTIRRHDAALHAERDRLRELELDLAGEPEEPIDLEAAVAAVTRARDVWSARVDAVAQATQVAVRLHDLLSRARAEHAAIDALAADHAVIVRLADTVAGRPPNALRMTLESFVLAAELEEIVRAANLRLDDMSAGRYRLQHTDARAARGAASGLGLEILDAHTGAARPAQSLSGGETFLTSLALALGLAEVVTARAGGVQLDTLFIDEGFGSLDDETLDLAMRTLDELRQGGRTVGLISHVAAVKEQIPAQLIVAATAQGPSTISQNAVLADPA
ncbi:Nuclease SbcCD subunit C [Microbacterium terrae]|uniref:Nuclease SbcCD subunit C n=1 Tax=Microbacterium terrae TaxID=69369 RepID=A0A0M2HMZ1_9MICO|nr:SMC family ATPase [Microbacterium terrae]KJL45804.1 Nuclease SbcCD subunit C [Microbacterium terrae]